MPVKDITGQRFGRLLAVEWTGRKNAGNNRIWKFKCDCGNVIERPSGNIIHKGTGSCGCFRREHTTAKKTTHGMRGTPEYMSWAKAKERTTNPNNADFKDYGAMGILMSEEFRDSFSAFISHIGRMVQDGYRYTLGRIDNSRGYEAGNVRWETNHQQARNKGYQVNNSSGVTGVTWDRKDWKHGSKLYAKAQWNNLDGSVGAKRYSVDTYGLLPAFKLACEYRAKMIEELNANGAGYSPNHGK